MSKLPRLAQLYLACVCVLGAISVYLSQTLRFPLPEPNRLEAAGFILLGVLAGSRKVSLSKRLKNEAAGSMSLGFAITFASLLKFGPGPAVFAACASCLSSCVYPKRQPLHQITFNVALGAIEALVGGCVYFALNGWTLELRPIETFVAVTGTSLAFFVINTYGVATIIALCTGRRSRNVWMESFLWTAPSYVATASISALALLLFKTSASAVLLFVLPVSFLVYQSYITTIGRNEEKQQHIEEMQVSQEQLAELYLATIKSLALAIDAKDQYTHQHILRVERYAVAIAREMGLTEKELTAISTGALLHDIGKLGVPEYVLLKPGRLTAEEFDKIKKHPEIGAAILDPVGFPWPVLPIVRHHHEKWDGTGYPDGLAGENIPLSARIMAVADVYDAFTSTRSYRRAWSHEKAVSVIQKDAGTHFDPVVVEAFLKVIDRVVAEMAEAGEGPLATAAAGSKEPETKADLAARDISRASSELWALYEVAQTLSASLGVTDTIEILSRKMEAIFPGIACVFLLLDEDGRTLRAGSAAGVNHEYFAGAATIGPDSLSMRCLRDGKTYLGDYDADDLMLSSSMFGEWTDLNSAMIAPIVCEGNALGTVNLCHPDRCAFSDYDRDLLEMIAQRVAHALYNGVLFDRSRSQAETDALTGLPTMRLLAQSIEALCGQTDRLAASQPFAILCIDLDSFKPLNDSFGHVKGDLVLKDVGDLLRRTVASAGTVARNGADEFLVLLDQSDRPAAEKLAANIEAAFEKYDPQLVHYRFGELRIGVSIGIACSPEDGVDCASLLAAADSEMHRVKSERKLERMAQQPDSKPTRRAA